MKIIPLIIIAIASIGSGHTMEDDNKLPTGESFTNSVPSPMLQSSLSPTRPVQTCSIDTDRMGFFIRLHGSANPSHQAIISAYHNSMKKLVAVINPSRTLTETSDRPLTLEEKLAVDEFNKYFKVTVKTVYDLPLSFKWKSLFSPRQALKALEQLEGNLSSGIEKDKFWRFCVRCLELPDAKLENDDVLLLSYISHINGLINEFNNRIQEDAFALFAFVPYKDRIFPGSKPLDGSPEDAVRLFKSTSKGTIKAPEPIKKIVTELGYDAKKLDPLFAMLEPLDTITRLANALQEGKTRSYHEKGELYVLVRVGKKMMPPVDFKCDITPEVLETVDSLLLRQFNKLVLQQIKRNFEKALTPTEKGFEGAFKQEDIF